MWFIQNLDFKCYYTFACCLLISFYPLDMIMLLFSFFSFVIENFPLLRTFVLSLNLTLGFESTNPDDYVYKEVILKNAVLPKQECEHAMEYKNPGG